MRAFLRACPTCITVSLLVSAASGAEGSSEASDRVVPGRLLIDPPTIENLGFRWYIEGDDNRNARVEVSYRRRGREEWKPALPMLRVHHEVANRVYGPHRTGNLFAGSVLSLDPDTAYEVRFVMTDPDGGAPAPRIVSSSTRAPPRASENGRKVRVGSAGIRGRTRAGFPRRPPVFAAVDSVRQVFMQVDELLKMCFSIGVMSPKVIPEKCVVPLNELDGTQDRPLDTIKRK